MQETTPASPSNASDVEQLDTLVKELSKVFLQEKQVENAKRILTTSKLTAHAIMNYLASRIFQSTTTKEDDGDGDEVMQDSSDDKDTPSAMQDDGDSYLQILLLLVQTDPSTYISIASSAIAHSALEISADSNRKMYVSPALRHVLVEQMTTNESAQVRIDATNTLVACTKKLHPSIVLQPAINELVDACWKKHLNNSSNKSQSSTIAVRCANSMIELWIKLGDIAMIENNDDNNNSSGGAKELIVQMLQDESDPLIQLSILDLLENLATKLFDATTTSTISAVDIREWLVSSSIIEPLCQMCGVSPSSIKLSGNPAEDEKMVDVNDDSAMIDPLLGGAALKLLSALCGVYHSMSSRNSSSESNRDHQQWLFHAFYRSLHSFSTQLEESGGRTDEAERLALVHAISNFASSGNRALQIIIDDPMTRNAWLSIQQISQPKLQAAILVSIAMVLDPNLSSSTTGSQQRGEQQQQQQQSSLLVDPSVARNLYNMLGYVNTSTQSNASTTNWLVNTKATSPFSEVRIATYTVLTAMANIGPIGVMSLIQIDGGWRSLEEFILNRNVEKSQDGRQARFEIAIAVNKNAPQGLLDASFIRNLSKHIEQGPHYMKPLQWDIAAAE